MPPVILDRFPLPSLQAYTTVSVLLLSITVYYAIQMTSDPRWNVIMTDNVNISDTDKENETLPMENIKLLLHYLLMNNVITKRIYEVINFIIEDSLCIWTLINMAYCVMIIIGKCIQKIVFGDLRAIEQQHMKDKFWNFVFYKFIFIFGVMNVQYMEEVVLWCGWFSFVGAFHLLSQLCRDRFEYLSFSPTTPKWTHLRLFALIFFILAVSVSVCIVVGVYAYFSSFCFMAAEWALVALRTLYILIRYILHLYDVSHEGIWEKRGVYAYYTELTFELASLTVDFLHHLHMLFRGNIFLSMATLVICMQLRCLFNEIQRKIIRHKNYLRVSKHMESNYPLASKEELESNSDDCAICWDKLESARKLPCGHMFHTSCLHSWLEQVTNCPTCRTPLVSGGPDSDENRNNIHGQDDTQNRPPNQTTNHFFHFDGSRYVSWFPSFSVEVSHTSLLGDRQQIAAHTSQLDAMVNQVLQMFPNLPYNLVMEDLLITRSVEATVENILDERLVAPAIYPSTSHLVTSINSPAPVGIFIVNALGSSSSSSVSNLSLTDRDPTSSASESTSRNSESASESTSRNSQSVSESTSRNSQSVSESTLRNSQSASESTSRNSHSESQNTVAEILPHSSQMSEECMPRTGGEGCRFSKSSSERQHMLHQRKEELIRRARNKYISRSIPVRDRSYSSSD